MQGGVFKPLHPLSLAEGSRVEIFLGVYPLQIDVYQPTKPEAEYARRLQDAKSLEEILTLQSRAPSLPAGYDLSEALNTNRQTTGERLLHGVSSSGKPE